jgi:hypothetical protein
VDLAVLRQVTPKMSNLCCSACRPAGSDRAASVVVGRRFNVAAFLTPTLSSVFQAQSRAENLFVCDTVGGRCGDGRQIRAMQRPLNSAVRPRGECHGSQHARLGLGTGGWALCTLHWQASLQVLCESSTCTAQLATQPVVHEAHMHSGPRQSLTAHSAPPDPR